MFMTALTVTISAHLSVKTDGTSAFFLVHQVSFISATTIPSIRSGVARERHAFSFQMFSDRLKAVAEDAGPTSFLPLSVSGQLSSRIALGSDLRLSDSSHLVR